MISKTNDYSVQKEAKTILFDRLINDSGLGLSSEYAKAAKKVKFTSHDPDPFIPTPCKITESASALSALVATAASVVASDRYGLEPQDIEVNTCVITQTHFYFFLQTDPCSET